MAKFVNQLSLNVPYGAPCFLTLGIPRTPASQVVGSQCTFWRSVLSDPSGGVQVLVQQGVLMHRLALGAF